MGKKPEFLKMDLHGLRIWYDPEATREAYAGITKPAEEQCGCTYCRNWGIQRQNIYEPELLELFDTLGIDHTKEIEVTHYLREEDGLHYYGCHLLFVGRLRPFNPWFKRLAIRFRRKWKSVKLDSGMDLGFDDFFTIHDATPESFQQLERPRVAIMYFAKIPWLLEGEEEPE